MNNTPKMMTINQLAELEILSSSAIRRLVKENKIRHLKIGSKVLINYDHFIDFLNNVA
ncbi:MAG: helix-turn-helix domain-containing protein [Ruminococcaceae bacterium]|nr:helix-turn-helix domain-containing protein [Oscillospiraceae bacterium]